MKTTGSWIVREASADELTPELISLHGEPPPGFDDPAPRHWLACAEAAPERPLARLSLERQIGLRVPHAWYRLGWAVHAAPELQLFRRQRTLMLGHDLTGSDALSRPAIAPGLDDAQAESLWRALADAVLRARAPDIGAGLPALIAELPGPRTPQGESAFWQGLGWHFHRRDLATARRSHGPHFDSHVAALLPRQLLYAAFLPAAAQAAMGGCSPSARPLQAALASLGFRWREHVAVSDGGAVMECDGSA
ncbi:MAG: arginine N-succinyltransferase [Rubrivivax sp.]|nr:arginine N-succinyltransferase [Rubrivivax sp.]